MNFTADRELILSRAYEHALGSAFAHGSALTDFSFSLPQPDDVLVFPNGNKAYRKDTSDSGYTADELDLHTALMRDMGAEDFPPLRIPAAFLGDTDTILESHLNDLSEIARGLVRDAYVRNGFKPFPAFTSVFPTFAHASFAFHEALLHATDALLRIDHAPTAARLMHELFPALLEAQESLALVTRRFSHADLAHTVEEGAQHQTRLFLTFGQELKKEHDFFAFHLQRPFLLF